MAAGTVAYTDTTGNKDYLGMIAGQISRRLGEASDMASDERAFAEKKAEEGGTSLKEAGIGKGYFFRRALGSRFGGDRIARAKGRMGVGGAGTDPTGNFRSRFRGGFDYNVTNEIQNSVTAPVTGALTAGLRGVEGGLIQISQSLSALSRGMDDLASAQQDAAKQAILNGAFMQAFLNHMQREGSRRRARNEERGLERNVRQGMRDGFGRGRSGGRGMINVTPPKSAARNYAQAVGSFALGAPGIKAVKGTKAFFKAGPKIAKSLSDVAGGKIAAGTIGQASKQITKKLAPKAASKAIPTASRITTGAGKLLGQNTSDILKNMGLAGAKTKIKGFLTGFTPKALLPAAGMTGGSKLLASMGSASKMGSRIVDLDDVLFKNVDKIPGMSAMDDMLMRMNPDDLMNFAEGQMDAMKLFGGSRAEALSDITMSLGNMNLDNADDVARVYGDLVTGGGLAKGMKFSQKEADGILKALMNPDDYAKYAKVAKEPIKKAVKNTFTHKMLRAPSIQKQVAKTGAKTAAKTGGKALIKSGLKKIPVIAGLAGIAFGIQRAMEGDLLGAGLEITSGILGATGVGGGLGLAIDGYLLGRDLGMTPLKDGIVADGALPAIFGEAGKEAAVPLEGAEGTIAGSVFGDATAESLVNFFAKRTNKGALPKSLLEAYPNLDPTNARDYMKLKRLQKESDFVYSGANNPSEGANVLNEASAKAGNGGFVSMPTTVINNYNAVAQGNSGSGTTGTSAFPSDYAVFAANYSLASKA